MKRITVIVVLVLFLGVVLQRSKKNDENFIGGRAMGTDWHLKWRGEGVEKEKIKRDVVMVLEKWEQVMSQWRESSDLMKFNRGQGATEDLERVMKLAREMRELSGGAFDMRVLKMVGEAGFGPGGHGVDLSGIGKGFAVDRVAESLRESGLKDFIFELGGEVIAVGGEWEVAIEMPDVSGRYVGRILRLKDSAMATSGNYRLYEEAEGGLRSHILDARTGKPVVRGPSSVSVVARDCATADGWATALFVLGREFPEPEGVSVIWMEGR